MTTSDVTDAPQPKAAELQQLATLPHYDEKVFHDEAQKAQRAAGGVLGKIDGPNSMAIVDSTGHIITGTPISGDFQDGDGTRNHLDFDTKGHPSSFTQLSPDGSTTRGTFDTTTGNIASTDVSGKDGSTEHNIFDPKTGDRLTSDKKSPDGVLEHDTYEKGDLKSSEFKYKDGGTERWDYDQAGYAKGRDRTFADGTSEHDEFNPQNGKARFSDVTKPDGTHNHYEFDPNSGRMISRDRNLPDGTFSHTAPKPKKS